MKLFNFLNNHSTAIQALASAIIAVFAIFSIFSWRTSVQFLRQQKKTDLIQNRPYVSMNNAIIVQDGNNYIARFSIKNEGRTPAYSTKLFHYYSNHIVEAIGNDVGGSGGYLGPGQSWKFDLLWPKDQVERIMKGRGDYYSLGVEYIDYLQNACKFIGELTTDFIKGRYEFFIRNQRESCGVGI